MTTTTIMPIPAVAWTAAAGHRRRSPVGWFADRGIRTKILTLVAAMAVVSAVSGAVALRGTAGLSAASAHVAAVSGTVQAPLGVVHQEEIKARMLIAQTAAVTGSADGQQASVAAIATTDADLQAAVARLEAGLGGATLPGWDAFRTAWGQWVQIRDDQLLVVALGVGLVCVVLLGLWVARLVRRQVAAVQRALQAMAAGDLTATAGVHGEDELGQIGRSVGELAQVAADLRGRAAAFRY